MASKLYEIQHDRGYEFMRIPEPRRTVDFGNIRTQMDRVYRPMGPRNDHNPDYQPPTEVVPIGAWPFPEKKRAPR